MPTTRSMRKQNAPAGVAKLPWQTQMAELLCGDLFDVLACQYGRMYQSYDMTCRLAPLCHAWRDGIDAARGRLTEVRHVNNGVHITNGGLEHIARAYSALDTFEFCTLTANCDVVSGMSTLARACSTLKRLRISGRLEDAWLIPFARHCKGLVELDLSRVWSPSAKGKVDAMLIAFAAGCENIRDVSVTYVTDSAVQFINTAIPHLRRLEITCSELTDAVFERPWLHLESLFLESLEQIQPVTKDGLGKLQAPMLDELILIGMPEAVAGLASASLPRLIELHLDYNPVLSHELCAIAANLTTLQKARFNGYFGDAALTALAEHCKQLYELDLFIHAGSAMFCRTGMQALAHLPLKMLALVFEHDDPIHPGLAMPAIMELSSGFTCLKRLQLVQTNWWDWCRGDQGLDDDSTVVFSQLAARGVHSGVNIATPNGDTLSYKFSAFSVS